MKRLAQVFRLLLLTGLLTGVATAQDSLADAARLQRHQREGKPVASKVITNDDIPTTETISTVGATGSDTPSDGTSSGNQAAASDASKTGPDGKPLDPAKARQKAWEEWRDRIQKQRTTVEEMQKESDEMEKQYRINTGAVYDNPANSKNGGAQWAQGANVAFRQQMEEKKKAIEEATEKIEQLQEEARKAGVPPGFRD
jgi:hypothetical protein